MVNFVLEYSFVFDRVVLDLNMVFFDFNGCFVMKNFEGIF